MFFSYFPSFLVLCNTRKVCYNDFIFGSYCRWICFSARLSGCLHSKRRSFLDIDKVKHINDTFGHEQGDKVLRRVSSALRKISKRGMIAHWVGDEFIGMLPTVVAEGRLCTFCDLIKCINDPVSGRIFFIIGACHVDKRAALEDLIRTADKGCISRSKNLAAKLHGKN